MANNNRRFVVNLEIDSSTAEQQIKATAKNFKTILADLGNASDKMTYFKELVDYISQIDAQLNAFKKKHGKDMFGKMFGNLDSSLQKQMQDLFGATTKELDAVEKLRQKITEAQRKGVGKDEAKALKAEVESLYAHLGRSNDINISNRLGVKNMLQESLSALDEFAIVWKNISNQVSKGFDFGPGTSAGSGDEKIHGLSAELQQEVDKIQKEVNELESLKKEYNSIIKKWSQSQDRANKDMVDPKKFTPETSIEGVQKLMNEFDALQNEVKSAKKGTVEYYQSLNKLAQVSIKLQNSKKAINADTNVKTVFQDPLTSNGKDPDKYAELLKYTGSRSDQSLKRVTESDGIKDINGFIKAKQKEIETIKSSSNAQSKVAAQNDKTSQSYDRLSAAVTKAYKSTEKSVDLNATDKDIDKSFDDQDNLNSFIDSAAKTKEAAEKAKTYLDQVWSDFGDTNTPTSNKMLSELCSILGVEIPQNAEKAESALKELKNTQVAVDADQVKTHTDAAEIKADTAAREANTDAIKEQAAAKDKLSSEGHKESNIVNPEEIQQIEKLEQKIKDVTTAVELKIQAFKNEQAVVDATAVSEVSALQKLLDALQEIVAKLKLVDDAFKQINNNTIKQPDVSTIDNALKNTSTTSDTTEDKASNKYALDATLDQTNSILERIARSVDSNEDMLKLVNSLDAVVAKLKDISSGMTGQQNNKKSTLKASERIDTSEKRAYLSGIAAQAVSAGNLDNVDINKIYAAKDGLVGISGAVKNADGVWEGFSLSINEANQAVRVVTNSESLHAKRLNEMAAATAKAANAEAEATAKAKAKAGISIDNVQSKFTISKDRAEKYTNVSSSVLSDAVTKKVAEYEQALNRLRAAKQKLDQVSRDDAAYTGLRESFDKAKGSCQKLDAELKKLLDTYDKFESSHSKTQKLDTGAYNLGSLDGRKQALEDYVKATYGATAKVRRFNQECTELNFTLRNSDGSVSNMTAAFDKLKSSIGTVTAKMSTSQGIFRGALSGIGKEAGKLFRYFTARFGIEELFQAFRTGIQYVRDIDAALTELKKVTNETDTTYTQFLQHMSEVGSKIGATTANLTNSAADWARLGYSIQEAGELAKNTAILLNVSEFENVEEATEAVIASLQAYDEQFGPENSLEMIDKLNIIGNNYAVSSDGIAEALKRSASTLVESGNDFEQSIAMVAAANKVIQDPEQVGAALKVLSMRIRGTKTELEAMGESTDDMAVTTSKLRDQVLALTDVDGSGGVDILTENGEYRNTYDILVDIAEVYDDILAHDNKDAAALTELLAGKHRANVLSSLLQNAEDLKGAYEMAQNAEGSALAENERYLDSIQGRIDLFTNALQTMWMNTLNSDAVKGVIDIGTTLIQFLDTAAGKLSLLVSGIMLYQKIANGITFKKMFDGFVSVSSQVLASIKSVTTATTSLTKVEMARAWASKGVSAQVARQVIAEAELKGVTGALTKDQIAATATALARARANGALSTSQYLAAMSTMGLKTAVQGLLTVLKANPIYAAAAAVAGLALVFDKINITSQEAAEAAQNAFDEIQSVVESTESTIQSLESELTDIQGKIDEINGSSLSFADNQELERLKAQKEELEHSLKVQEDLLELQNKSKAEQAVASMKAYTKAASQGAEETQKTAKNWGSIAGAILGAGLAIALAVPTGGTSLIAGGTAIGASISAAGLSGIATGAAAGGIAGNKLGEWAGSKTTENSGTYDDWYETYTKALETARAEEQKALENYEKDSSNIDKLDKWQEAQRKTSDIETEMYNHLSQMQQYYNGLEYGVSNEIDEELDTWNNFLDKFAIAEGSSNAKVNALDRIFGEDASQEIKDIKDQIKEAVITGKDFDFGAAISQSEELNSALQYVGLSVQDVEDYFTQLGEKAFIDENITSFKGYSALSAQVESYNTVLSQTSDYLADNVEVTQEYKDSLKTLGVSQEDLNDCFYENNDLVVKDAAALQELVDAARNNVSANIDLAESHARLQYYDLVQQLNAACSSTDEFTKSSSNLAHSLLDQIDVVQQAIYKYHLLQNSLNGADGAFTQFTEAKNIDALNTTGTTMVEMMQTLYNGFYKTGEVGTQAFEAAIDGLIPDSVLAGLESKGDQLEAAFKYYKKELLPSLTNDNDTISIGAGDVNSFIQEAINAGALSRDKTGDLDISKKALKEEWDFADIAKKMNKSEAYVNAMMHEVDKNLFDDNISVKFSQGFEKFDNQLLEVTENIEDVNRQKLDLLDKRRLTEDKEEIAQIDKEIAELNTTIKANEKDMSSFGARAAQQYEKYAKNEAAIAGLTELQDSLSDTEKLTATLTKGQAKELGLKWQEGKTVQQYLDDCLSRKDKLGEPTELTIQYALQGLADETEDLISTIKEQLGDEEFEIKVKPYVEKNEDGTYEIDATSETSPFAKDDDGNVIVKDGNYSEDQLATLQGIADNFNYTEDLQSLSSSAVTAETHLADISSNVAGILGKLGGDPVQTDEDKKSDKGDTSSGDKSNGSKDDSTENKSTKSFKRGQRAAVDNDLLLSWVKKNAGKNQISEDVRKAREEWDKARKNSLEGVAPNNKDITKTFNALKEQYTAMFNEIDGLGDSKELVIDAAIKYDQGGKTFDDLFEDIKSIENKKVQMQVVAELTKSGAFDELLSNLDEEEKEFVIKAITEGTSDVEELYKIIDTLPDDKQSMVQALVDYILGEQEPPEDDTAGVKYEKTEQEGASDETAGVEYFKTDQELPELKEAPLNYWLKTQEEAKNDEATVDYVRGSQEKPKSFTAWVKYKLFGGGIDDVNGTAHAKGTAWAGGTARKGGSWGAKKTETALVGELGPELVVRGSRWFTVGDQGTEFANIQKGDIIFNHKQTEQLFANGYITGRGKMQGSAHAQGTAYAGATWSVKTQTSNGEYKVKKTNKKNSSKKNNKKNNKDAKDEFQEVFDWFEVKIEEINEDLDLMAAKLENAITIKGKNNILSDMIATNKSELKTLEKGKKLYEEYAKTLYYKIPKKYRTEAKNGKIAIEEFAGDADEKTLEAIKNYREWAQKVADVKKNIQEVRREITELAKQKFDNIIDKYDNITTLQDNRQQHYTDMADYREDKGYINSGVYYEAAISEEKKQKKSLKNEKKKLQTSLNNSVKKGDIKKYSAEWYDMVNQIHAVDAEIDECTANIEDYQNKINEINFENFEKGLYRVSRIAEETQNIIDLLADKDAVKTNEKTGDVEWTDEGLTQMGLYAQKMENYKKQSDMYAKEIDTLNNMYYKEGVISFDEYLEKLDELKDGQYDAIQGYEDSKDAIVDMQKARVDAIKEGIEKEIEAYSELIDKKKEELSAEKDLYDFRKSIEEQSKSVSDIERQIAALAGDNSASARAQRKKLEAERAQAQQELQDNYYDRSVEKQQEALDTELEQFTELREKEMEGWDKWLENVDGVFEDAVEAVQNSGTVIQNTIQDVAKEWDLQIVEHIRTPWSDASTALSETSTQLDSIISKFKEAVEKADDLADTKVEDQKDANADITGEIKDKFQKNTKVYAKKGTQVYDANGKKDFKTGYDTSYTVVSTDNSTGLTKVKNSKGKIRYIKTSDLSATAPKNSGGTTDKDKSGSTKYYKKYTGKSSSISDALKAIGADGSLANRSKIAKANGIKNYTGTAKQNAKLLDLLKKGKLKKYAKGSLGIDKDQLALIDELGEELQIVPDGNGRLDYMKKGTGIIPADITSNLMNWGELNPQDILDRNRPSIGASPEVHATEINLNIQYGDMLKIDNFKGDNPDEIAKIVAKQFEKHTKDLNNALRKYVR